MRKKVKPTTVNLSNLAKIFPHIGHIREYWRGKYHCTVDLLFDWFGISCMTTGNFCFYLQNRLIQTSQTGGQRYSDTSPFSIPWTYHLKTTVTPSLILLKRALSSNLKFQNFFRDLTFQTFEKKVVSTTLTELSCSLNPVPGWYSLSLLR